MWKANHARPGPTRTEHARPEQTGRKSKQNKSNQHETEQDTKRSDPPASEVGSRSADTEATTCPPNEHFSLDTQDRRDFSLTVSIKRLNLNQAASAKPNVSRKHERSRKALYAHRASEQKSLFHCGCRHGLKSWGVSGFCEFCWV